MSGAAFTNLPPFILEALQGEERIVRTMTVKAQYKTIVSFRRYQTLFFFGRKAKASATKLVKSWKIPHTKMK